MLNVGTVNQYIFIYDDLCFDSRDLNHKDWKLRLKAAKAGN